MNSKKNLEFLQYLFSKNIFITKCHPVSGGSINHTYIIELSNGEAFFVKENTLAFYDNFYQEELGLNYLRNKSSLYVPEVYALLKDESKAYLILEKLEKQPETNLYYSLLGKGLAELHLNTAVSFGWNSNNYIGSLPQSNKQYLSWNDFFINERLDPLFNWCYNNKFLETSFLPVIENLYKHLDSIFPKEKPALLHGDFWTGNRMSTNKGAAIFDPSVYYGHREMDIAMANLFGRLPNEFYMAYNELYPLEKDYKSRIDICNLYPLLVHARLFGKSYMFDIISILNKFK